MDDFGNSIDWLGSLMASHLRADQAYGTSGTYGWAELPVGWVTDADVLSPSTQAV